MSRRLPTPRRLYVHDDLSAELRARGEGSAAWRLGQALLGRLARDPGRVTVGTLEAEVAAVVARGVHRPFAATVAVGAAGLRAASALHARTGWFPRIHRLDVWREEDGEGRYALAGPAPLAEQLAALAGAPSVAVVDDTIFSGLTLRAVLAALPAGPGRLGAFGLRAVGATLAALGRQVPVTAGVIVPGRALEDASIITAGGLVRRGAIRRAGQAPLAFFERPEWIAAWFPDDHEAIVALCRELAALLDADARS